MPCGGSSTWCTKAAPPWWAAASTVIEKGYQHGGDQLRAEGVRVESLAIVESMDHTTGQICFRD